MSVQYIPPKTPLLYRKTGVCRGRPIFLFLLHIHVMSLKVASGRFFFHFREVFEKCIDYIGKFLVHFREVLKFS